MASTFFIDLEQVDFDNPIAGVKEIEAVNPQRGDMRHLDAVVSFDAEANIGVGYKDVRPDEFWVPGHIPDRPLLPGVLMIEAAAQFSAYLMKLKRPEAGFIGFVGCDNVKFRSQVTPPGRLVMVAREKQFRP
ncbi:MAG: 3-hydroxyacyl-ACP dehydratase FabZ family protein, partial [Phycisphaeraceae bacterium]